MMRQSMNLMVVFGLLFILACTGSHHTSGGNEHDGKLITPTILTTSPALSGI